MSISAARTRHQHDDSAGSQIPGVQTGIGVIVGVFEKGTTPTLSVNFEDWKQKHGSGPMVDGDTTFWGDWYAVEAFFLNAENAGQSAGKLITINVRHYSSVSDPTTTTAVKGHYDLLDSTSGETWTITDKHYRVRPGTAADSPLDVKIVASAMNPAFVDMIVYENDVEIARHRNLSATSTDPNYVLKVIPASADYEVTDNGLGTLPAVMAESVALTDADNGLTGLNGNDFVGAANAGGNTGIYQLESYLHTVEKPSHGIAPWFDAKTYDSTTIPYYQSFADYLTTNNIQPILGLPKGLNRTLAKAFKQGSDGNTYAHTQFLDTIDGTIMVWPNYTPVTLMETLESGQKIRITPTAAKMGLIFAAGMKKWIHRTAAGPIYGKVRGIGELEVDTEWADSETLEPVGIQVIRKDKGNVIDSHQTISSDPNFKVESVRYRDNYAIHAINLGTEQFLHENLTEKIMDRVQIAIREFFQNIFDTYPDAFTFSDFDDAVDIDVRGQNTINSADWIAGKLYTRWRSFWSYAIQEIVHRWSHTKDGSEAA